MDAIQQAELKTRAGLYRRALEMILRGPVSEVDDPLRWAQFIANDAIQSAKEELADAS